MLDLRDQVNSLVALEQHFIFLALHHDPRHGAVGQACATIRSVGLPGKAPDTFAQPGDTRIGPVLDNPGVSTARTEILRKLILVAFWPVDECLKIAKGRVPAPFASRRRLSRASSGQRLKDEQVLDNAQRCGGNPSFSEPVSPADRVISCHPQFGALSVRIASENGLPISNSLRDNGSRIWAGVEFW